MKHALFVILTLTTLISCKLNQKKKEQQEPNGQRPSSAQLIDELDSNKDGKLSKVEVKGPIEDDFNNIDSNNDGFLTLEELNKQENKPSKIANTNKDLSNEIDSSMKVIPVNTDYFISENIIDSIKKEMVELNGIKTLCYVIKTNSQATEHEMGPWCPRHIEDGMEKAGIWFKDDKVYDVSGHFISKLNEFYSDDKWKLYREDGTIKVTDTEEGCLAAAKPQVEEKYHNYCVECLPEYFKDQITTFVIPVTPKYIKTTQNFGRGGIGIAFNGVKYDPPAPTHAILAAHTIAPLDDHGGHVNPHGGYHYHAVTGSTKEITQTNSHSSMIGYAIDGFGIYGLIDKKGNKSENLDECGGHFDDERGYHYHAGEPGGNQIIKCLHGLPGYTQTKE
ncbi:YHYH protein [Aquimarina sp. AD1]|uniref:YHYH protein n=1 Tax=Aquimarina sp. (strain AD1) TaxID=1714848 RepID=UPI000E52601A|nr:YHYH protein [Aquimarina sp. AD1]AXT54580.1 YHYH protein [Aquimarina sp. AD1]RKN25022.1 YHYH protein [Aquimarina sp. AD1]